VTSAVSVSPVLVATLKLVSVAPERCSEIVFGGQATINAGVPLVFVTSATTVVVPGCREVTTPFWSLLATAELVVLHVNGPTFDVMSCPPLKAFAVNCSV
jgi:hypothetical protein